jgi:hypothetical protein
MEGQEAPGETPLEGAAPEGDGRPRQRLCEFRGQLGPAAREGQPIFDNSNDLAESPGRSPHMLRPTAGGSWAEEREEPGEASRGVKRPPKFRDLNTRLLTKRRECE